jgi:vancomycin resistance protein YoaR
VSQVSSALYIAALCAGLDIYERHPHAVAVDYAPPGLDAAVTGGNFDLKFYNNSDNPITIKAQISGQSVIVGLMGRPLESGLVINTTYTILGYTDASGNPIDYTGSNVQSTGDLYYEVISYRQFVRNNNVEREETLAVNTYLFPRSA